MSISVLIVDDDENMRLSLKGMVSELKELELGIIDFADDGDLAKEKLNEKDYSLLLLDWCLGDVSGAEVLEYLIKEKTSHVGVVVLSGSPLDYIKCRLSELNSNNSLLFLEAMKKPVVKEKFKRDILSLFKMEEVY